MAVRVQVSSQAPEIPTLINKSLILLTLKIDFKREKFIDYTLKTDELI